jgi:hypothetical protein
MDTINIINIMYIAGKKEEIFYTILGYIISMLTLGFSFRYYYPLFFERGVWYTRKNLLHYLQNNDLPNPEVEGKSYRWCFGRYNLYYFLDGAESFHFLEKADNCVLSSWHNETGPDAKRYSKIKEILEKEIIMVNKIMMDIELN